jgi:Ser/Thr protein kinase RdoA (MazF antagonist)
MTGPHEVATQFQLAGRVTRLTPLSGGHIHDSYRVETEEATYLLQRINASVFPHPENMLATVCAVSAFRATRLQADGVADWRRRAPVQIPTRASGDMAGDSLWDGAAWWRVFSFVEGAAVHRRVDAPAVAREAGRAFGAFLRLLAGWDRPPLPESLPGFHDTARRVADLERAVARDPAGRAAAAGEEIEAARRYRPLAAVLPPLVASGAVPRRLVHNDAKISNVLYDAGSGAWLCVVDLDTVMPGTALYDFGDLVRSSVSPADEDETDVSRIDVRLDLFEALAGGYLETAGPVLSAQERDLLVFAGELITFEQAIRFLTDHLEGDRYFRVARPGHNLVRARAQLALLAALRRRQGALADVVARLVSTRR